MVGLLETFLPFQSPPPPNQIMLQEKVVKAARGAGHHESLTFDYLIKEPLCPEDFCRYIDQTQASSIPR